MDKDKSELYSHITKLHTTQLGIQRIERNLKLQEDVVAWCQRQIIDEQNSVSRKGKNWYVYTKDSVITINAHSDTIITAHKIKK